MASTSTSSATGAGGLQPRPAPCSRRAPAGALLRATATLAGLGLCACGGAAAVSRAPTGPGTPAPTPSLTSPPAPASTPTPSPTLLAPMTATPVPALGCSFAPPASPAPAPATTVLAVRCDNLSGSTDVTEVDLVTLGGHLLNHDTLAYGEAGGGRQMVVGVGASGVYLYDTGSGVISRLGLSGSPETLGSVPEALVSGNDLTGMRVAEAPSGGSWIVSLVTWGGLSDTTATTDLLVDGGGGLRSLTSLTRLSDEGGGYRVLGWGSEGVLLGSDPTGVGGAGPFLDDGYTLNPVVVLDPSTAQISSQQLCATGNFEDLSAAGGDVVCRQISGGPAATLEVGPPGGPTTSFSTDASATGHAVFSTDGSHLSYCTSAGYNVTEGGWTETLWSAPLGGAPGAATALLSGDGYWCEGGVPVGTDALAEVVDGAQAFADANLLSAPLVVVDLGTGATTQLGTAGGVLGAL